MTRYDPHKTCGHGKAFDEECLGCELVLLREGVKSAEDRLARYKERIAVLERARVESDV